MFKKLLATAATLLLAAGLSVVAVAAPASATHPSVGGTVACNPTTGQWDITWRVTGDTQYPNATATVKTETLTSSKAGETPTLESSFVTKTVKGTQFVEIVQRNATLNVNYKLNVQVQFDTHTAGQLTSQTSTNVKPTGTCVITPPAPVDSVDCSVIKYVKGAKLDGTDYINATFIQPGKGSFQMNLEINEVQAQDASVDSPTHLYVLIKTPGGDVKYPLTVAERDSGILTYTYSTYLTGTWTVDWIQYASHNTHFEGELVCGTPTPDSAAAVKLADATCAAAQTVATDTIANATWGTIAYSGTDNLNYSVTATATANHKFAAGDGVSADGSTKTFTGTLNPQLSGDLLCPPEAPKCLPSTQVSYTYFPWNNGGKITVTALPGYSDTLCDDFYVTVATWTYDKSDNIWPQTLKETQNLYVDKVDTYDYGLPVECGQGDVYASFTSQPVPSGFLTGPGAPYEPGFLHNMGFTGPAPTYVNTKFGCNVVEPVAPVVQVIEKCSTYGSVIAEDTDQIDYTITGTGNQGTYTVTAVAKTGYILDTEVKSSWSYELGEFTPCKDPKVTVDFGACYPNGDISSKNVYVTFDNSASDIAVTYTIKGGASDFVQAVDANSTVANVEVTPIWHFGGSYDVYVDGEFLKTLVLPPFDQCQDDIIPADPKDSPAICTNGVIGDGSIWVDLIPGKLAYTIHDVKNNVDIAVTEATTYLPAGDYIVSVVGINGFNVSLPDDWKHDITIGSPENCDVIDVPTLAEPVQIVCAVGEGSYVLPKTEYIDWYVNGEKVAADAAEKTIVTAPGTVNIEAKINTSGIYFPDGSDATWEFVFTEPDCIEPTLTGSTAVGTCEANAPFINYSIKLDDPDNQVTTRDAYLVLTNPSDPTVTEKIFLGTIGASGLLEDKVLWPGASVAPDGVTATGWPGWEQDIDGNWVETDSNFRWTRDVTQAVIEVNPSIVVALAYPDATPQCDNPPELPPLATVTPTFDSSALSCTVAGSYTLGEVTPGTISWTVSFNGGAATAATIGQTAVKTPGTYEFVATPTNPEDGLDPDWLYNDENPLAVTFSLPAAGCDVKTLALTGVAGIGGVTLLGGLLVVGGIMFFFLRRRTAE